MALEVAGLTQAMQNALDSEWRKAYGSALPAAGLADRRLLFAAVARGLLSYLDAHQTEAIKSIQFVDADGDITTRLVKEVDFDITASA